MKRTKRINETEEKSVYVQSPVYSSEKVKKNELTRKNRESSAQTQEESKSVRHYFSTAYYNFFYFTVFFLRHRIISCFFFFWSVFSKVRGALQRRERESKRERERETQVLRNTVVYREKTALAHALAASCDCDNCINRFRCRTFRRKSRAQRAQSLVCFATLSFLGFLFIPPSLSLFFVLI